MRQFGIALIVLGTPISLLGLFLAFDAASRLGRLGSDPSEMWAGLAMSAIGSAAANLGVLLALFGWLGEKIDGLRSQER